MGYLDFIKVDQEVLLSAGSYVQRLKMTPYFDIAHYLLMIASVRDDLGLNQTTFSRRHPLSCWLSSMVVCFAGSLLANFLLGESLIAPFKKHDDILLATACWYLIFYSPFDVVFKLTKITPIKLALSVMKEIQRAYKIQHGVVYAAKLYPNAYLIHVIVGTAKGAGSGIIKVVEQLVRGVWIPTQNEILRPSFATKACVIASIIFTLDRHSLYISLPHEITYLCVVAFFVYFKLSAVLLHVNDPLAPFENLFCAVFMGGIWDALSRAVVQSRERKNITENGTVPTEHKKEQ
jgi:hypothetical protein